MPAIRVVAANAGVADAAISSRAGSLTLDLSGLDAFDNRFIRIPDSATYFALIGNRSNGIRYKNLRVESDAAESVVSNMTFVDSRNTPLRFGSEKVTLSRVSVENAPGFALILTADSVALGLYGTVSLRSSGDHAVISKNVTLAKSNPNVAGALNLTGNYLICGEIANSSMLSFTSGEIVYLDADRYESMLTSSILTLDPNGGEVDTSEKLIYYGQPYGELPTPTRSGYSFAGWFTEASGGKQVTADSIVEALANQTLYAHWEAMAYTAVWTSETGYTISVSRSASPYADAAVGALESGATVYYGDVLSVQYVADTGYTLSSTGSTSITVTGDVTSANICATATVNSYTVSWNTGTGYSITVSRTSSPNKGAATGNLTSGATVYYGDILSVSYTRADYYHITSQGASTITVTGHVTSDHIYASAQLNDVVGWVKASKMPAGAQVVDQKWSYTKTTTTESTATSTAGYTQIGSYWVASGSGSTNYSTAFPGGFDTGHWIYTSFAKSAVTAYENATNKREVSNSWSGYVYWHWIYDTNSANGTSTRAIWNQYGT